MRSVDARYGEWVDMLGDLLQRPLRQFPVDDIAQQLRRTLNATAVSWNWWDGAGRVGMRTWLPDHVNPLADPEDYFGGTGTHDHPLVLWAAVAGIVPQTLSRVPWTIAGRQSQRTIRQLMVPLGIEEQMSLPLLASGRRCRSFVVAQAGQDFTCNDLAFAQRVQPTLLGLARQVSAVRRWESLFSQAQSRRVAGEELAETRLTGSELAVLQLLGQGLTATTIANRLGVMPRTVHKHLQHVYAKLHTSDRLTAVIIARRLGILTEQES